MVSVKGALSVNRYSLEYKKSPIKVTELKFETKTTRGLSALPNDPEDNPWFSPSGDNSRLPFDPLGWSDYYLGLPGASS